MEIHNVQLFMQVWFIYMLSHTSDAKTGSKTRKFFQVVSTIFLGLASLNLLIK